MEEFPSEQGLEGGESDYVGGGGRLFQAEEPLKQRP